MKRILDGWQEKYHGLRKGFAGLRVSGNTAWLESKDWESFSEYEQSIDSAIDGSRILVLCTYSLDRCSPYELLDVVRNHQFASGVGTSAAGSESKMPSCAGSASKQRKRWPGSVFSQSSSQSCDRIGPGRACPYLNPAAQQLFPDLRADASGTPWMAGLPDATNGPRTRHGVRDRCSRVQLWQLLQHQRHLPRVRALPAVSFASTASTSPTRKRVEKALQEAHDDLEKRVCERTTELQAVNQTLRMISECNQVLVRATTEERPRPGNLPDHQRCGRVSNGLGWLCRE